MSPPPDWTRQSAQQIAAQVRQGLAKSATIAAPLLERIKERDSVHAWAHIDRDRVLSMARSIDAADKTNLPLAGVPVGIKDLMDTFDQPTAYGAPGEPPAMDDSPVVQQRRVDETQTLGRNDPCWCGSGKKFKKCHGA